MQDDFNLENAYFESIKELKESDIVKGKILKVSKAGVIVDVGYKAEGIIPKEEFIGIDISNLKEIDVYVENIEDEEGKIVLSFKKARELEGWKKLMTEYKEGDIVEGIITKKVKGGYMVDVFGIEGFLPQSLSTFKNIDTEAIGNKFNFQIIKMTKPKESFILSRRDVIRIEKELQKKKIWEELEVGKIVRGKVKAITNFGAFIDLGGIDGLLHIGDMSWKKISHPSEVVAVGDELDLIVLSFNREQNKVSLGLKQIIADPWKDIDKKYPIGSMQKGRVTNLQNYGVFVELEKGIEGLIHISEISWTKKIVNLSDMFAVGDTIEVKVIGIDIGKRRISLSLRQLEKDPWENIEEIVVVDSIVKGIPMSYTRNFVNIKLENGLDGIIYNEDISWTKRVSIAKEILKKDQVYDFKVLGIDKQNRKVILGLKQLKEDPWPKILEKYPIGSIVEVEVIKITNFGVFVKLEEELEGLIFSSEIDKEALSNIKPKDKLKAKILKIDPKTAKVGLSTKIDEENRGTT